MEYESGQGCKFKESHNMVVLVFQKAKSMFMTVCGGIIIKRSEADQIADLF